MVEPGTVADRGRVVRNLRCGEERFCPVVRRHADAFEVVLGERTFRFALDESAPGVYAMSGGDRVARFYLARDGDTVHLWWDGATYALVAEREGERRGRRQDQGALETPMPGRVTAVKVVPGQSVTKGQEMIVIEAMKMENALRAPLSGAVRAVHAKVGDMVAPGRTLVELEAES